MSSPLAASRPLEAPSLDDLARDLSRVVDLPAEARQAIVLRCASIIAASAGGADVTSGPVPALTPTAPEEWITEAEVQRRFGLTPRWLRRHRKNLLQEARVASRLPGAKATLYHARRLARLIESHALGPR